MASPARERTATDGDDVDVSEGAERACGMVGRGLGAAGGASAAGADDGRGRKAATTALPG